MFDFADPNIQRGRRTESTIASQALLMMNHPFVIEQSRQAATNLLDNGESGTMDRVRHVYQQVLGRNPADDEMSVAVDFIQSGSQEEQHGRWAMLYQTLFQCIDFRYLN